MGIFTRRSGDEPDQPPGGLPTGYDDPDSPWFVPEEVRPFYRVDEQTDLDRQDGDRVLRWVRRRSALEVYERRAAAERAAGTRPRNYPDEMETSRRLAWVDGEPEVQALRTHKVTVADRDEYLHAARLADAQRTYDEAQAATRQREQWTTTHTCDVPGCGVSIDVASRQIAGRTGQLCAKDADAIARAMQRRQDAEKVGDRTRAQLAEDWLEAAPAPTMGDLLAAQDRARNQTLVQGLLAQAAMQGNRP